MQSFILGFIDMAGSKEDLVQFADKKQAAFESEEWCEVFADTLEEAKDAYEAHFDAWRAQFK